MTDSANSRILRGYVSDWMSRVGAEFNRVGVTKTASLEDVFAITQLP